jgi:hypothetical protein
MTMAFCRFRKSKFVGLMAAKVANPQQEESA